MKNITDHPQNDASENKVISLEKQKSYFQRLIKPYQVNHQMKLFITQYLRGNGSELVKKFWSENSSSRFAFDLYSWISTEKGIDDFEFEYKLPGIKSGTFIHSPNMDVYIKTKDTIYFIESKFKETRKNISKLQQDMPGAYYQTLNSDGTAIEDKVDINKPTFYLNSVHKMASAQSLAERFSGHVDVAESYVAFCKKIIQRSQHVHALDWFDVKQELCHLLGIILFMVERIQTKEFEGIKTVHFSNIFYSQGKGYSQESKFTREFISESKDLVKRILDNRHIQVTFEYDTCTAQEVIRLYGSMKAFENDNKTVRTTLEENFPGVSMD